MYSVQVLAYEFLIIEWIKWETIENEVLKKQKYLGENHFTFGHNEIRTESYHFELFKYVEFRKILLIIILVTKYKMIGFFKDIETKVIRNWHKIFIVYVSFGLFWT